MVLEGLSQKPASSACAFCQIIRGELEGHVVLEDDLSVGFLDRRPLFPGHCLLAPREHYETLVDLPASLIPTIFSNAQLLARAVEQAMDAQGTFVAINNRVSQSVPHLHVHVVPRRRKDGLRGFFWPRTRYRDEEHIRKTQHLVKTAVAILQSELEAT